MVTVATTVAKVTRIVFLRLKSTVRKSRSPLGSLLQSAGFPRTGPVPARFGVEASLT